MTQALVSPLSLAAIVVAGGSGNRMGRDGQGRAKQWWSLMGRPVVTWSLAALKQAGAHPVVLVVPNEDLSLAQDLTMGLVDLYVPGGQTRDQSVLAGLKALIQVGADASQKVLIHDAARPGLMPDQVKAFAAALEDHPAALFALPLADTLTRVAEGEVQDALAPVRTGLYRAQTPQGGRLGDLKASHDQGHAALATDDATALKALGVSVTVLPGAERLMKLTAAEDFTMVERLMSDDRETRVGQGFDAHRWGPGTSVWLCGVELPHDQTLVGHSDADAGLHALTDALLGTIGAGDIGDHFPPTDPKWKGASSDRFLIHAHELVTARGGQLINVDVTLICEQPKVKPHREKMRARLAELLSLPLDAVSVKATTTEKMGFTGRGEGLAAQALAVVSLPRSVR